MRDLLALDWVDHEPDTFFAGLSSCRPAHCLLGRRRRASRVRALVDLDPGAARDPAPAPRRRREELPRAASPTRCGCACAPTSRWARASRAGSTRARSSPPPRGCWTAPLHAFTVRLRRGPGVRRAAVRARRRRARAARARTIVVPDGGDFWEVFDALVRHQEEPTAGPGRLLAVEGDAPARTTHGLKVLLDGQGGDETLGRLLPLPARTAARPAARAATRRLRARLCRRGRASASGRRRHAGAQRSSRGCRRRSSRWRRRTLRPGQGRACSARRCAPLARAPSRGRRALRHAAVDASSPSTR